MKDDGEIDRARVGHTKADETDVYAGRGTGGRSMVDTEIGVRGWLGNPHTLDEYSRAESIGLFRDDFEARLRGDQEFREAVRDLAGETLGCWCQRLDADEPACHAEVIAEWADKLARDEEPELITDGGRVQDGDGLYQHPTSPCPADGCGGEISAMPRSDELLCSEDASHLFNRGVVN